MIPSSQLFYFRSHQDVQTLIPALGVNRIVELCFPNSSSSDKISLFSQQSILALCSKVMGSILESITPAFEKQVGGHSSIPLDEEDPAAWEEALAIMHHIPACDITWENAERLLRLADKYDVACIIGKKYCESRGTV
jgi:hypothetical protein